MLKLHEQIIFV